MAHRSLDPTRPPLAAEDLVVLGVLCALLEAIGAREVRARIGAGGPVDAWSADHGRLAYPCPDAAGLALAAAGGSTARWRIDWTGTPGTPGASSKGTHEADLLASVACLRDPSWPPIVERTAALLAADLARPPALPALAAAVGCSPRSLQRALAAGGTTRAGLLADLRARAAAWWLLRTAVAPAEIGFVCGYADQPHFTRQFRDRVGVTPAKYREAFGSA